MALKHYSWSALSQFGTQIISLVGNIFIARILSPDDYGLIAMLAIFIGISMSFAESGFADCLIRKDDTDDLDFSTIFMYNIVIGLACYLILYISATYIATFYGREELIQITQILGLSIVLRAATVTEITRLRKNLRYDKLAIVLLISSITSIILAYFMAIFGFGYWALVSQMITQPILQLLLFFIICDWRPSLKFSFERFKKMNKFAYHIMIAYFVNQIGANLYSLFIGNKYTSIQLGYYSQSTKLNDSIFKGLNGVIMTTSYSIIAREKEETKRKKLIESTMNVFVFTHFLASFYIIGCTSQVIYILLGEKWVQSSTYFQLLTISFLLQPITLFNANIANLTGNSNVYKNLTFLRNGLILIALLLTFQISVEMMIVGQIIARFISATVDSIICGKFGKLYPNQQLKIIFKQSIIPLVSLLLSYYIANIFENQFLVIIVYSFSFSLFFILGNMLLKNNVQSQFLKKLLEKIRR